MQKPGGSEEKEDFPGRYKTQVTGHCFTNTESILNIHKSYPLAVSYPLTLQSLLFRGFVHLVAFCLELILEEALLVVE